MILGIGGFFSVILSIIVFILVIGVIILIHEFGHFIFARRAGILCHEFSIGMGPVIYQKKTKETTFSIRAIPVGGFVSMAGEDAVEAVITVGQKIGLKLDESEKVTHFMLMDNNESDVYGNVLSYNLLGEHGEELSISLDVDGVEKNYFVNRNAIYVFSKKQQLQITPHDRSFESKSIWQRFITLFAGAGMNFVLAIVVYFIYWCGTGVPNTDSTVIGEVSQGYYSYEYLEADDKILAVNGVEVSTWDEFSIEIDKLPEQRATSVELKVARGETELEFNIPLIVIINSCGLNNVGLTNTDFVFPSGVTGVMMGDNSALNYVSDLKANEVSLQLGDIITEIRVDTVVSSKEIIPGEYVAISSWSDVIDIMSNTDVGNVYLKFYSQENKGIYESQTAIETHGNELLDNQRIEKILLQVGVSPEYHFSFGGVIANTFSSFWSDFTLIFRTLKILIAPSGVRQVGVSNLSGIVGIFSMVDSYMEYGFLAILSLVALLSINIGVMNLLPIPALDGGRIVFLIYEAITRKKPNKKFETLLNNIVFILLMILFVYITFNDILRLFK